MKPGQEATRLRIYLGEDKRHGEVPLYQVIIAKARRGRLAGATILRGTQGYGRSTRLHTADVLFSDDLPVIIEIVEATETIAAFLKELAGLDGIGMITSETVTLPAW
jgi:hypothetical protein